MWGKVFKYIHHSIVVKNWEYINGPAIYWKTMQLFYFILLSLFIFYLRQRERVSRRRADKGKENPKQTSHCQSRAQHGAWSQELRDHDLSRNQKSPNQLSYPDVPLCNYLKNCIRAPGWLSWLNFQLLISAIKIQSYFFYKCPNDKGRL